MRTKLLKRILYFMLTCVMVFVFSSTAFAAEPIKIGASKDGVAVVAENDEISVAADVAVSGMVSAWSSKTFWPHLSNYIGFSKTIRISTSSSGNSGGIEIELKKSGNLKSDGNWLMGINDTGEWTLTLPASGDYELIIHNKSGSTVYIAAQWLWFSDCNWLIWFNNPL